MFDFIRKSLLWEAWDSGIEKEIGATGFSLKSMQDVAVYLQLRDLRGQRVAEIGAGNSRVLPTLAKRNTCVAVEKFEGQGAGPTEAQPIRRVQIIPAYLGENDPQLADESFDVVFSISVVEHVTNLDAFHADQLRILKPGGMFLHAIDLYISDEPDANGLNRFNAYRNWVTSDGVTPIGPIYTGPCRFTCDLATNPDNIMHAWGAISPTLIGLRQVAQSVSLLIGGRKLSPSSSSQHGGTSSLGARG